MAPKIHDLYPDLEDGNLLEAEHNLDRYLTLVLRIFERLELDEETVSLTLPDGTLSCSSAASESSQPSQPCGNTLDT